jgi:putative transposase
MISNFPKIVKESLSHLSQDDYPVLDSFLFVSIWLGFVLDQSQTSMRSMFKRLNIMDIDVDISTFSKASKKRDSIIFWNLFVELRRKLKKAKKWDEKKLALFPLDSTIVTLTSKLLWSQGFHQVNYLQG